MTGYDKLRHQLMMSIATHRNDSPADLLESQIRIITAAGIPIEDLANGKVVTVPKDPYNDLAISSR